MRMIGSAISAGVTVAPALSLPENQSNRPIRSNFAPSKSNGSVSAARARFGPATSSAPSSIDTDKIPKESFPMPVFLLVPSITEQPTSPDALIISLDPIDTIDQLIALSMKIPQARLILLRQRARPDEAPQMRP